MPAQNEIGKVTADFGQYVDAQVKRLANLRTVLENGLPLVSDIHLCNKELVRASRPDLIMTGRAEMMPIETPEEVVSRKGNNFASGFIFYTGVEEKSVPEHRGLTTIESITITREQMMRLSEGVFQADEIISSSHAFRSTFQRMLVLFPDFTIDLVKAISSNHGNHDARYESELFVAYQLMSRLVDVDDEYVLRDGKVNEWYLCG